MRQLYDMLSADEMREILKGTGAEIIEGHAPVVLMHPTEFRQWTEADEPKEVSFDGPSPKTLMMQTARYCEHLKDKFREEFGGAKLVVYKSPVYEPELLNSREGYARFRYGRWRPEES